jgi:DHA1 family tetracycline resistance protein-like MFS transporter
MSSLKFQELLPLYAVITLGFLGYALTLTLFIPMIMDQGFGLVPSATTKAMRATLTGSLLAMYPLGQFFGAPIIGNLSDHFGRKRVLLCSLVACALGFLGMSLSIEWRRISLLFLSSFLTGLFESNMAIAQSVIADRAQDLEQKIKFIGYAYAASSLGYVFGPLLAGIGGSVFSYSAPFLITALGVLCVALWIIYSFVDPYLPNKNISIDLLKLITAIKFIFRRTKIHKFYFVNFMIFFSVLGLYRVTPLYVIDHWRPSLTSYSLLISFVSLLCVFVNLFFLKRLAKEFSTQNLLSGLLISGGILVILIVVPQHFFWIWFIYGAAVIPTVMALPTCTSWLSHHVPTDEQGQALGNNQALLVLGESSSAAIGGLIAAISIPLPIILIGIILCITGIVILKF